MKISEIIQSLEEFAPPQLQEEYDNSGLNIGNAKNEITGIIICIDVTPEVVKEAISKKCNLIISHHPLIFSKIKKITGANYVEESIILAIKNDISIYCGHTNFDSIDTGVSAKICDKLELKNRKILSPKNNYLKKIAVYTPESHTSTVRDAMFVAGAGKIGNYDSCSFNISGEGSFRANEGCKPFVGEVGELHFEKEVKIEMIFPIHLEGKVISAMLEAHPYEEVAYDIYSLTNKWDKAGLGMLAKLEKPIQEKDLLDKLKKEFNLDCIKHSEFINKPITKIAVCGGSGAFLIETAKRSGAQVFISGDIKYHDYFAAENKLLIVDIGHFESEQFTKEIFYDIIMKKNPNFAVHFSEINTNPIKTY